MTKYTCNNCGAKIKAAQINAMIKAGFDLRMLACPECGQHAISKATS